MRISDWSSDVCSSDLSVPWLDRSRKGANHDGRAEVQGLGYGMAGGTGRTQSLYFGVSRIPSEKSGGDPDGPRQKVAGRPLQRVSHAPLLVAKPADRECHLKTRSYTRSSSPWAAAPDRKRTRM